MRHRCTDPCWSCGRRRAICASKRRYDTWDDAWAAKLRTEAENGEPDRVLLPYRCRYCDHYHIGHHRDLWWVRTVERRIEKARRKRLWRDVADRAPARDTG